MGDGGKVVDKDRGDGAVTVDDVQGGGSDGADLWERELGSYGGDAEGAGRVPPSGGSTDSKYFRLESWGGEMGVVIGVGGLEYDGAVAIEGVHLKAAGYHCGIYCEFPHL